VRAPVLANVLAATLLVPTLTALTRGLTVQCRHTALVCSTKSGAALAQTDSSFASYVTHVDAVLSACTHSSHLHAAMVPSAFLPLQVPAATSSACCHLKSLLPCVLASPLFLWHGPQRQRPGKSPEHSSEE
jgi:hypothetical protein